MIDEGSIEDPIVDLTTIVKRIVSKILSEIFIKDRFEDLSGTVEAEERRAAQYRQGQPHVVHAHGPAAEATHRPKGQGQPPQHQPLLFAAGSFEL